MDAAISKEGMAALQQALAEVHLVSNRDEVHRRVARTVIGWRAERPSAYVQYSRCRGKAPVETTFHQQAYPESSVILLGYPTPILASSSAACAGLVRRALQLLLTTPEAPQQHVVEPIIELMDDEAPVTTTPLETETAAAETLEALARASPRPMRKWRSLRMIIESSEE